jgi:dihydrofolate synthase / folylpolyglutamate synthase
LDATKLVEAEYIALTKIGLDHTAILGDTVDLILLEKLGIISPKTKCLFALEPDRMNQSNLTEIIYQYCQDKNIELHLFRDLSQEKTYLENYRMMADWMIRIIHTKYLKIPIPIPSRENNSSVDNPRGRLETLHTDPIVLYDTAHNADAVQNVIQTIKRTHTQTNWKVFVACLPDKNLDSIIDCFRSSQNIEYFHVLSYPPFQGTKNLLPNQSPNSESSENAYEQIIESEDKFTKIIQSCIKRKDPILVLGSFRIYSKLKEILY